MSRRQLDELKRFADVPLEPDSNPLRTPGAPHCSASVPTHLAVVAQHPLGAQPKIDRFLPDKGFQTLVLLMALVITGSPSRACSCSFRKCSWPT